MSVSRAMIGGHDVSDIAPGSAGLSVDLGTTKEHQNLRLDYGSPVYWPIEAELRRQECLATDCIFDEGVVQDGVVQTVSICHSRECRRLSVMKRRGHVLRLKSSLHGDLFVSLEGLTFRPLSDSIVVLQRPLKYIQVKIKLTP